MKKPTSDDKKVKKLNDDIGKLEEKRIEEGAKP